MPRNAALYLIFFFTVDVFLVVTELIPIFIYWWLLFFITLMTVFLVIVDSKAEKGTSGSGTVETTSDTPATPGTSFPRDVESTGQTSVPVQVPVPTPLHTKRPNVEFSESLPMYAI